jgi:hypothetical protein
LGIETLESSNEENLTAGKKIKKNLVSSVALTLTAVLILGGQLCAKAPALNNGMDSPIVIKGASQGEPVIPSVFDGDLRDLPLAEGWKQADPVIEILKQETVPPR